MANEELLGSVPFFAVLDRKELTKLARDAHDISYPAGKNLSDPGALGATFFVVAEGELEVSVGGEIVRTLGPGDSFGEMALIDRGGRSASVVAKTDCRCLVFSAWSFRPFVEKHPDVAWAMLELMVRRVREAEAR
jgi:CRP/FNR family transcriptional regulator, cyclic AMP receptor protein